MAVVICTRPECQTTAGCRYGERRWLSGSINPAAQRAHKVMTKDEYLAAGIKGWHEVCFDVDGFGGVGVRYLGQQKE